MSEVLYNKKGWILVYWTSRSSGFKKRYLDVQCCNTTNIIRDKVYQTTCRNCNRRMPQDLINLISMILFSDEDIIT